MRIREIVAISGMGGLFKVEGQKPNGLIVTSLQEGWTKFVSNRQNMFSLLENISIYTETDNVELADVLVKVHEMKASHAVPDPASDTTTLRDWFTGIQPDHDQEKVYISDIKKLIRWYNILDEKGIMDDEIKARADEAAENTEALAASDDNTEAPEEEVQS